MATATFASRLLSLTYDFGQSEGGTPLLGVVAHSCAIDFSTLYAVTIGVIEAQGSHARDFVEAWLIIVLGRMGIRLLYDVGSICHDSASNMTAFMELDNVMDLSCLVHLVNNKFKHVLLHPEFEKDLVPASTRTFADVHNNLHMLITTVRAGSAGGLRMQHFLRLQKKGGERVLLKLRLGPDHKFVYAWIEWERVLKLWSYVMQLDEEIMGNTIAEKDAFIECKLQLAKDKDIIMKIAPILREMDRILTILSSESKPLAGLVIDLLEGLIAKTEEIKKTARLSMSYNVEAIASHFLADFHSMTPQVNREGVDEADLPSFDAFIRSDLLKVCRFMLPSAARHLDPDEFDQGFDLAAGILLTELEEQETAKAAAAKAAAAAEAAVADDAGGDDGANAVGAAAGGDDGALPIKKKKRLTDHEDAGKPEAAQSPTAKLRATLQDEKKAYLKFCVALLEKTQDDGGNDDLKSWRTLREQGKVPLLVQLARKCAAIQVSNLSSERVMNHIDSVSGGRRSSMAPARLELFSIAHADMKNITTWTKEADTLIDEEDKDIQADDLPNASDDE